MGAFIIMGFVFVGLVILTLIQHITKRAEEHEAISKKALEQYVLQSGISRLVVTIMETIDIMVNTKEPHIAFERYHILTQRIAELELHTGNDYYNSAVKSARIEYQHRFKTRTIYQWQTKLIDEPKQEIAKQFYCFILATMAQSINNETATQIKTMVQQKAIENRRKVLIIKLESIVSEMESNCTGVENYNLYIDEIKRAIEINQQMLSV